MKTLICLILALSTGSAMAETRSYVLQPKDSVVGFETDFGPDKITGRFPISTADLSLDFQDVTASTVSVTLDASGADASFPFAAQALKGPKVLDTREFPMISFASSRVRPDGDGARVDGMMTIRGQAKPATLHATIYRQHGTEAGDLRLLTIHLTGSVLRSSYGATGWADMVGDEVRIDILARIERVD
jgi:polyisoprenoid-binding protein YceI